MSARTFSTRLVAAFALTAAASASQAAFVTFNSLAAFNAATITQGTDTFNNLAIASTPSPLLRSAGAFGYRASVTGPFSGLFFPAGTAADVWLSTNSAPDSVVFDLFGANVKAIGGLFFGSNILGDFAAGNILLEAFDSSGSVSTTLINPSTSTFFGFATNATLLSLRVTSAPAAGAMLWPTINDLRLGTVPTPGTMALVALALLAAAGVRRRT